MPYSFFEIERQKNWLIGALFVFLASLYFLSFIAIWLIVKNFSPFLFNDKNLTDFLFQSLHFREVIVILIISFMAGFMHWSFSQFQLIDKILGILKAESLNTNDRYHQILKNVIDEVSIASGGGKFESYVIPTSALNAFSIADFNGRQVIGITEGLLAKLNRRQLEAVIGHEVAHILSGDCLYATVACSLLEFYSALLNFRLELKDVIETKGSFILSPIYIILSITRFLSYLLNICISRQREYRADAISARFTRDPLSLAEALYIISRGWKGEGMDGDELSSIFIVSPKSRFWDENEGFLADMLSTHPPIKKRIEILLGIAGKDIRFLEDFIGEEKPHREETVTPAVPTENKWYVRDPDNLWRGPLGLSELPRFHWLKPNCWVRKVGEEKTKIAYEDDELKKIFQSSANISTKYSCPNCYYGMEEMDYEGTTVWRCVSCKGFLIKRADVFRILFREEKRFSEETIRRASLLERDSKFSIQKYIITTQMEIDCPQCHKKMRRVFLRWAEFIDNSAPAQFEEFIQRVGSKITPFAIDKCIWCDLFWFDGNKLEILQYLYEKCQSVKQYSSTSI